MVRTRELRSDWTPEEIEEILSEHRAVTLPVSITVSGRQKVVGFSEAESVIRKARLIGIEDCWCRQKLSNCKGPLDVCLTFDDEAKTAIAERGGRRATAEEALDALERSHKAGLVHLAFVRKGTEIFSICGCCSCCCHTMAAITRFGYDLGVVEKADVVAVHEPETCKNCKLCVSKCQFDAWGVVDGKVRLYALRCSGCGVCASSCPTGSLRLVPRKPESDLEWTRSDGKWVLVPKEREPPAVKGRKNPSASSRPPRKGRGRARTKRT